MRRNRHNDPFVATYDVDRNINYTNVCVQIKFIARKERMSFYA